MNVSLGLFWRLNLDDKVHTGDVQTSCGNICSHQNTELLLLETFEGHLALRLRNIAMHHLNVVPDLLRE